MIISPSVAAERSTTSSGQLPTRRLVQFGVITVLLTWLPWAVLGLTGSEVSAGPTQLIFGLAASGPSLAALILWLRFRRERIRTGRRISWYGPLAGLLLGAAPAVVTALVLGGGDLAAIGSSAVAVAASAGGPGAGRIDLAGCR